MTVMEELAARAADAPAPALDLLGVIDIGSNSIRLVVFENGVRSPDYFFNEKTICGLGRSLGKTGRLDPDGKTRALAALKRFTSLAARMGVSELVAIGTAALRDAEDGPAFRDLLAEEVGLTVRVVSGEEEARLAAEGVLMGWPAADGVIADLGGSSLELATAHEGQVGAAVSVPAGHLRLIEADADETRRALKALAAAAAPFAASAGRLIMVGGAWRALAKAHMGRENYPFHVLQGYEMTPKAAQELTDWAVRADESEIKKAASVSSSRIPSLVAGARALRRLLADLEPDEIGVSAFGVREGVAHERMSDALRREEPLIAAARRSELRNARCPGFGEELFAWMTPLLGDISDDRRRLAEAACLLHDVNWRTHPDYRAAACFGTVARGNLGGVGHNGRLFVGAALLHRYKGGGDDAEAAAAVARLSPEDRREAEIVGRAARLGAMVSGSTLGTLGKCTLRRDDKALTLTFAPDVAAMAGERVERRLAALAEAIGLEPRLVA